MIHSLQVHDLGLAGFAFVFLTIGFLGFALIADIAQEKNRLTLESARDQRKLGLVLMLLGFLGGVISSYHTILLLGGISACLALGSLLWLVGFAVSVAISTSISYLAKFRKGLLLR